MYNEFIKISFVQDNFTTSSAIRKHKRLFEKSEELEIKFEKDLCEFATEELNALLPIISGARSNYQGDVIKDIKRYVKWCKDNTSLNTNDSIFELKPSNFEKIRNTMVSGPEDLQNFLDQFFESPTNGSHGDVFRGFLWLAFMGFKQSNAVDLKTTNVDFVRGAILNGNKWIRMYKESYPVFENLVKLKSFKVYNSSYKHVQYYTFDRDNNDLLLRLKKGDKFDALYLRNELSKIEGTARKKGLISRNISFEKVALSGIFYRKYQDELTVKSYGILSYEPDFTDEVLEAKSDVVYKSKYSYNSSICSAKEAYKSDYKNWKEAFDLE